MKSWRVARAPTSYARLVAVQPFRMRYPLVDGQGNFGSIDDDPPAESRYTEVRLAPIAQELPRFPNLLVNGSRGIPPHNLSEAIAAVIAHIDDPDIDTAGLMEHMPGPDFPTGGIVLGGGLHETYQRGRGSLRIRARTHVEDDVIVVTELPYTTRLGENGALREIVHHMREGRLPGINFSDHSRREGMRILIGPGTGADPNELLTQLFKHTSLEIMLAVDMVALVDGEPRRLSLRDLISGFLADRDRAAVRRELLEIAARHRDSRRTSMSWATSPPRRPGALSLRGDTESAARVAANVAFHGMVQRLTRARRRLACVIHRRRLATICAVTTSLGDGEPAVGPWRVAPLSEFAQLVLEAARASERRPPIVALDGRSSSGKTSLASRLERAISGAVTVHTDDIAWWHSCFGWAELLASGVLEPLRRGQAVAFRPPAWDKRNRPGAIEVPPSAALVIVEGVGAGRREIAHLLDAIVWVQSDLRVIERRNAARVAGGEADADGVARWMHEEFPFIADQRPWARAFVVVAGTTELPHDPAADVVLAPPPGHHEAAGRPSLRA